MCSGGHSPSAACTFVRVQTEVPVYLPIHPFILPAVLVFHLPAFSLPPLRVPLVDYHPFLSICFLSVLCSWLMLLPSCLHYHFPT